MEFADYIGIARRRWWLLLACLLVGVVSAFLVTRAIPPEYRATATLLVVHRPESGSLQLNDLQASERLANTFSRLILLDPVLSDAAAALDPQVEVEALRGALTVNHPAETELLEVTAGHRDPGLATEMANTVAATFIASNQAELSSRPGLVTMVESAREPDEPATPRLRLNLALGGMAGLLVGGVATSLLEYRDDKVRNGSDVARAGLLTLGHIERFGRRSRAESPRVALDPGSTTAEAYRGLRTTLTYALDLASGSRVLLVTSASEGEGKTTTAANLAVAFGLTGRRTAIVDADLRRPSLDELFGVSNATGLTGALAEAELRPSLFLKATRHPNVELVTAGPPPLNPSELLGSARMEELITYLRAQFDVVLLDTPPALAATDASVLAELADASLIVTTAGRGTVGELASVASVLAQSERPVLGVVINRAARRDLTYGAYTAGGYPRPLPTAGEPVWPASFDRPARRRPDVATRADEAEAASPRESTN